MPYELTPHSIPELDLRIRCDLTRQNQKIIVQLHIEGEIEKIKIAAPKVAPARRDELWTSTCFELFVSPKNSKAYMEANVSPVGDWNLYSFNNYREGMKPVAIRDNERPLTVNYKRKKSNFDAEYIFDLASIHEAPFDLTQELDVSVTLVIEDSETEFSYWAIQHEAEKADFHLRKSFIASL